MRLLKPRTVSGVRRRASSPRWARRPVAAGPGTSVIVPVTRPGAKWVGRLRRAAGRCCSLAPTPGDRLIGMPHNATPPTSRCSAALGGHPSPSEPRQSLAHHGPGAPMSSTLTRTPFVSAVICTRNRPDKIGHAVASVLASGYPNFDLTVIDQSTTDGRGWPSRASSPPMTGSATSTPTWPACHAPTTLAIGSTTGEILAFTDDDCVVPTEWISKIVEAFGDDRRGRPPVRAGGAVRRGRRRPHPPARHPAARATEPA